MVDDETKAFGCPRAMVFGESAGRFAIMYILTKDAACRDVLRESRLCCSEMTTESLPARCVEVDRIVTARAHHTVGSIVLR